ncbi:MAG: hypothetical protein KKH12_15935 [Gammaproteobacteria bacterium]|nr:hypothetical protein [Gammaproteobacteria bacterium]
MTPECAAALIEAVNAAIKFGVSMLSIFLTFFMMWWVLTYAADQRRRAAQQIDADDSCLEVRLAGAAESPTGGPPCSGCAFFGKIGEGYGWCAWGHGAMWTDYMGCEDFHPGEAALKWSAQEQLAETHADLDSALDAAFRDGDVARARELVDEIRVVERLSDDYECGGRDD